MMRLARRTSLLVALSAALLTACATTTVTMKNPRSGQIIVCQRPTFGSYDAATSCADALKKDGWIELGRD